ncbi:hypothetical protein SCG7109_AC_00390 [Chlamydiales bacterium SCGC AG-110-M15]|nr:hypothetical protein SCG7109_AC_00390 [Chlamydiales bacterium SCGC AG-110-M15]
MKVKKTLVKELKKHPLSKRVKRRSGKGSNIFKSITDALDVIMPKTLKNWLNKQFLLSSISNDVLLHAMDQMTEKRVTEVEVILSNGDAVTIYLGDIQSILQHLNGAPFEMIIDSAMGSDFDDLRNGILGPYLGADPIPMKELTSKSSLEIHKYLTVRGFKSVQMSEFIDQAPLFVLHDLLKRVSDSALWDILMLLSCSEEEAVDAPLLTKLLDSLSSTQIMRVVEMIVGDEGTLSDVQLITLRNVLGMMPTEKIPFAISVMSFPQKKSLLGQFRERPMGVTMSIANGKMELYQIAAGLTHPKLVMDILNSVEWMDEIQIRTTKATLDLIGQSIKEMGYAESKDLLEDKVSRREFSRVSECCSKIVKLLDQKYHPLHREINKLAKISKKLG